MNSYQAIAKEVCRMLDFQPSTIIFTIINLLVLYFFFRKFLFGRVNAVLEQREQLIEKEIGEAEEKNQKAEAMQKEYEDKLAGAREEAAQLVGQYEIVTAEVAQKALPECNIVFIEGAEMKEKLSGYLSVLFEQNPQSVGGALPDDAFYFSR